MLILGINDTHDASACLVKDGKLLMALAEERLTRTKNIASLPVNAINYILEKFQIVGKDINLVAVSTKYAHFLNILNIPSLFYT